MTPAGFVVPEVLRVAGLVPRERVGWRVPQFVAPGAFRARDMPVPERPQERNAYQLTRGEGFPWSPPLDRHVRTRGAELRGRGGLAVVDLDVTGDGDGIADLARLASSLGVTPDVGGAVIVATPGHGSHQPGRHLWFAADPSMPVRFGPLKGWPRVEIKGNGTCPGSPGYRVLAEPPGALGMLPRWLARVAGPPVSPGPAGGGRDGSRPQGRPAARLTGLVRSLLEADDDRNRLLFRCAARCGEMIRDAQLERDVAESALMRACEENGYIAKHGYRHALDTIRSGFRTAVSA